MKFLGLNPAESEILSMHNILLWFCLHIHSKYLYDENCFVLVFQILKNFGINDPCTFVEIDIQALLWSCKFILTANYEVGTTTLLPKGHCQAKPLLEFLVFGRLKLGYLKYLYHPEIPLNDPCTERAIKCIIRANNLWHLIRDVLHFQ